MSDLLIEKTKIIFVENEVNAILNDSSVEKKDLGEMVSHCFEKKENILKLASSHQTPFYVLDLPELHSSIDTFTKAFQTYVPGIKTYYAVKTNYYAGLLKEIAKKGLGFDVSSSRELKLALEAGGTDILYTGPGKTISDLKMALQNTDNVIVNIDSFTELKRLGELTNKEKISIRAGVRIYTSVHGKWSKFGIPIDELKKFWEEASTYPYIHLQGIQFHISWNENATPYVLIIKELSEYITTHFTKEQLKQVLFIDFGGGFRPHNSEGIYPWITPAGAIVKTVYDQHDKKPAYKVPYIVTEAMTIDEYAQGIGAAIDTYLRPVVTCSYFTEPGRIICNNAMHVVVSVVDRKSDEMVITDGGINMVGWERFEFDYFPVLNLSKPSMTEKDCTIYGSLCMPQDLFGYHYYGEKIDEGDVLMVPYQGHLTYSLAQNFIKEIPEVVEME